MFNSNRSEPRGRNARRGRFLYASALISGVLAPVVVASSAGQAQERVTDSIFEEITVTAQFREQRLQETPIAITAITGAMMDARSQTSIFQVSAQAPNVTLKPQGAAFGPSMGASIRGVGQYDFNPAYEPGVGLYVDDVYFGSLTGAIFDLLDLERVEILRGPQGTLAGKNSIGGAVKLYSKKPTGEGEALVSGTYGSRDRLDLRAMGDFKLAESLFARLSGVAKKQEGYVERRDYGCVFPASGIPPLRTVPASGDCVVAKEGEIDYNAVRAQLRWDNGGPVEINIIGDYTHDDRTTAATVLTYANFPTSLPGTPNPSLSDAIDPYTGGATLYDSRFVPPMGSYYNYAGYISETDILIRNVPGVGFVPYDFDPSTPAIDPLPTNVASGRTYYRSWGLSGQVDWELSDSMQIVSVTAYREWDTVFSNDDDASPLAHSLGRGTLDYWAFSQEIRLNGSFGAENEIEYTLGGYYFDQRTTYATYQDLRYAGLPPFQGDDPVNADSLAGFFHLTWHATDALTLNGGVRYTDESKDYTYTRRNFDGTAHPVLGALDGVPGVYSGDRWDFRAAVQYQWTDDFMTYAQFATGFKGGGINPRPFVATQVQPFGQESLKSFEIGAKSEFFDRRLRLNIAGFYSDYNDIQLTANTCPQFSPPVPNFPCALPVNAGTAEVKGVELEATIAPVEGLSIDGAVSYQDFDYTSVNPVAGGIDLTDVAPYTPTWKWSIGAQYEFLLGNFGTITPRIDVWYQDEIFTNAANLPNSLIDSYTLADARITWRDETNDWEAALEVTNLFDKYYFLTKFDLSGISGFTTGQPGRPREWAFTIKRRF